MLSRLDGFGGYALRRVGLLVPVSLAVLVASFVLMRAVPGGPFDAARALSPAVRANLEHRYGLDRPLPVQFERYVVSLLHGDLGDSLSEKDRSVADMIGAGAPVSLLLGAIALLLALALGVTLGLAAGLGDGFVRRSLDVLIAIGLCVPPYVLAPALILAFGLKLHWLPVAGYAPGRYADLLLPVVALAWLPLFEVARLARAGAATAASASYVRAASARGLGRRTLLARYVLAPAVSPVLSYVGPLAAGVLAGSLVVERVFSLPGMGGYLIEGALARDYPLVLGATLVYLVLLVALNLLADLLLGLIDPRVRRHWSGA